MTVILCSLRAEFCRIGPHLRGPLLTQNDRGVSNEMNANLPLNIWRDCEVKRPIEQLTLVDMFKQSDQVARAIMDHIERGFLPKVRDLERLVRPNPDSLAQSEVTNLRVRNYAASVISSDDFTHEQSQLLDQYLKAIDDQVSRELNG